MLDARQNRLPITRTTRAAIAGVAVALAIPVAIAAQNRVSTLSGTIVDQTNKVMPEVALTLTNTSTSVKYEARSDPSGRFQFTGLPSGRYELRAAKPGFKLHVEKLSIDADVTRDLNLELGDVQETITVGSSDSPTRGGSEARSRPGEPPMNCTGNQGGDLVPPAKLKDVRPVYPADLKAAHVSGLVNLFATVGTDGRVSAVKTISSPNADFERAATDAVKQWEFSTTYLNCTPVEVKMQVTVNFTTERK